MARVRIARAALEELERLRFVFERGASPKKIAALDVLREASLGRAKEVLRLHDLLCFLCAYPDDRALLERARSMLDGFHERADLVRHADELVNSGIAGTEIHFAFYWFTLAKLVRRWPDRVRFDWSSFTSRQRRTLEVRLYMLLPYVDLLALEEASPRTGREWIELLKREDETDAAFFVRRMEAMRVETRQREAIYEEVDLPFRLLPGPDTPSATHNRFVPSRVVYQKRPPVRSRESFRAELDRPAIRPRAVAVDEARRLLDMAMTLMVTRERDLDCFVHGDERDVRVVDYPEGFQLACIGSRPDWRQVLDSAYGFLMLRNGVLIGYVLSASLFGSSEVAYNVSPAFRGAEAAHLYARCLHTIRHLFGADTFMVDPYQMGHENSEGLKSGAWWFYYKLGFRPRDPAIRRLAEVEERSARARKGYRSSLAKLNRLSSVNMYLSLGEPREDIIGEFDRGNVGLRVSRYLAERFGSDREEGLASCERRVARLLDLRPADLTPGERTALRRWAPLVSILPDVERWPARDLSALAKVVRAKGARRESEFVRRFDAHARLREAVFELGRTPSG